MLYCYFDKKMLIIFSTSNYSFNFYLSDKVFLLFFDFEALNIQNSCNHDVKV